LGEDTVLGGFGIGREWDTGKTKEGGWSTRL